MNLTGFVDVTPGDVNALKVAIVEMGPISVTIDAALESFTFYSHGVYYDPKCSNLRNSDLFDDFEFQT